MSLDCCVICLEDLESNSINFMTLHCSHSFHIGCILTWLSTGSNTCPLCKQHLNKDESIIPLPPPMIDDNEVVEQTRYKYVDMESLLTASITIVLLFYLIYLQNIKQRLPLSDTLNEHEIY